MNEEDKHEYTYTTFGERRNPTTEKVTDSVAIVDVAGLGSSAGHTHDVANDIAHLIAEEYMLFTATGNALIFHRYSCHDS